MKVEIIEEKCIGCGACVAISNDIFDFNGNGLAVVKEVEITKELEPLVLEAIEVCPTEAIKKN